MARNAARKEDSSSSPPTTHPMGIDALYLPEMEGLETRLQFQWMRLHPSSIFSQLHDSSAELAGLVCPLEVVKSRKRKRDVEDNNGVYGGDKIIENGELCTANHSDYRFPVSGLFDPPLLTEWIPGAGAISSAEGEEHAEEVLSSGLETKIEQEAESADVEHVKKLEVMEALSEMISSISENLRKHITNDANEYSPPLFSSVFSNLSKLSFEHLSTLLPSRTLLTIILDANPLSSEKSKFQCLSVSIRALHFTAQNCPTKEIGKYLLLVLVPVLLQESNYSIPDEAPFPKEWWECEKRNLIQLANTLVADCRLGDLSRLELLEYFMQWTKNFEAGECRMMKELQCCVGDSFFAWKGKGSF